jgi:hypothetical protein
MKRLILAMLLTCTVAGMAWAQKGSGDGASDTREGGETFGDALVIPDLPFSDTGATCDNHWDVDFSCGYTAGISPDVFYSYTACVDGTISVSLCGSGYDTELAIFNSSQVEIACNDDFCGLQSEIDGIPVVTGETYYIAVSGFFGGCGSYTMSVTGPECPPTPTEDTTWGQIKSKYR